MRFYKFALWKSYFDTGYGLMSLPKYVLILAGFGDVLSSGGKVSNIFIGGFIFGIVCFFLGKWWFKVGLAESMNEVGNRYNLFVKQMRRKIKTKSI